MTAPPGEGGDRAELEHLREEQARWLKLGAEWHQELAGLRAENERLGVALDVVTRRNEELHGDGDGLRVALANLTDRAEASQAITGDEADEYRKLTAKAGGS